MQIRYLALLSVILVVYSSGCTHKPTIQDAKKPKNLDRKDVPAIESQGISVIWSEKKPDGSATRLIELHAESGELTKGSQSGNLNRATGKLYRENRARARFSSDILKASQDKRMVIAIGHARVWSIDPVGGVLTADKVTYYIDRDLVLAEGRVTIEYTPVGSKVPLAFGGPVNRMTIDTELKKFHIP